MLVLSGHLATRLFGRMERRRKHFAVEGPQPPVTKALRLEIDYPWPNEPDKRLLSAIKSRDSVNELIYDRQTAGPFSSGWHLYRVKQKGGTASHDVLVRQDIDFGTRTPGWWLIQTMDAGDLWREHASKDRAIDAQFAADDEAERRANEATDREMEEAGRHLADGWSSLRANRFGLAKRRRRKLRADEPIIQVAT